jgi:hypothetical protein
MAPPRERHGQHLVTIWPCRGPIRCASRSRGATRSGAAGDPRWPPCTHGGRRSCCRCTRPSTEPGRAPAPPADWPAILIDDRYRRSCSRIRIRSVAWSDSWTGICGNRAVRDSLCAMIKRAGDAAAASDLAGICRPGRSAGVIRRTRRARVRWPDSRARSIEPLGSGFGRYDVVHSVTCQAGGSSSSMDLRTALRRRYAARPSRALSIRRPCAVSSSGTDHGGPTCRHRCVRACSLETCRCLCSVRPLKRQFLIAVPCSLRLRW